MVADLLLGILIGGCGLWYLEEKKRRTPTTYGMGMMNKTKNPFSGMGKMNDIPKPFDFNKCSPFDITSNPMNPSFTDTTMEYHIGETNMYDYMNKNILAPYEMKDYTKELLLSLEESEDVDEIKYKLKVLKKDLNILIQHDDLFIREYKQLLTVIDEYISAINVSLDKFKKVYISDYTNIHSLMSKLNNKEVVELGKDILAKEDLKDAKIYKSLLVDNEDATIKKYLKQEFEPEYNNLVLKICA